MSEKEITEKYDQSFIDTIDYDHNDFDNDDDDDDFCSEEYDVFQSIEDNLLLDSDEEDSEQKELDF